MGRPSLPSFLRAYINNSTSAPRRRRRSPNSSSKENPGVEVDPSWESSIREKLGRRGFQLPTNLGRNRRTISRVPDHIRRVDPAAYEPTVVSIGPIHRNKEGLLIRTDHKWLLVDGLLSWVLSFFLRDSWHDEIISNCLKEMMALEAEARLCYPEEDVRGLSKEELAEILLLDGCFIVWFLMRHMMDSKSPSSRSRDYYFNGAGLHEGNLWIWSVVKYDLLKLENQIPFFVIEAICDQVNVKFNVAKLLRNLFDDIQPPVAKTPADVSNVEIHHLLHLYHVSLLPPSITSLVKVENTKLSEWIPSATELRDVGVDFKNRDDSNSFLEVRFDQGILEVPRLYIYRYSNSILRNLIAFEQCYPVAPYIASYALFMSYMVHTAEDVRLLHLAGIVYNGQSTDEDVARFFKRLCDGVQYAFDANYLSEVFMAVRRYHESPWHTWKAGLQRDYFSNPWVIVSVVAASLLLVLTFLQTFFTVFAYYRPPN